MIFSTRRRTRSGPVVRGTSALSRALGHIWRRSLQLRVVVLTLGLSAVVILALGFVLTSQITNRVLDVKVRAATEEVDRARGTVSGIVNGEEARSLDSSLQLARNTLISKPGQVSGDGLAGTFDAVLMVPGDGPRDATSTGPVDQIPASLRDFVQAGQVSYQYTSVRTEGFSGPALLVGTPAPSRVTNLELYLIFPLTSEESTITLVRGTMATGGLVLLLPWVKATYHPRTSLVTHGRYMLLSGLVPFRVQSKVATPVLGRRNVFAAFVALAALTVAVLSLVVPAIAAASLLCAVGYLLVLLISGAALAVRRQSLTAGVLYPLICFISHVMYGLGAAWGLGEYLHLGLRRLALGTSASQIDEPAAKGCS